MQITPVVVLLQSLISYFEQLLVDKQQAEEEKVCSCPERWQNAAERS